MRKGALVAAILAAIALFVWWIWPSSMGQPLDSSKSIWASSEVPQVGSIIRLTYNPNHDRVLSASYLDGSLSGRYSPIESAFGDEQLVLKNNASVALGAAYLQKAQIGAKATLNAVHEITVKATGERVIQWKSLDDLQAFLRKFDGKGAPNADIHDLYAKINQAGDEERKSGKLTPYWVVTKVFTGTSVSYSSSDGSSLTANATCGSTGKPCVVPATELTASLDRTKDKQNILTSTGRPIFVVIKPLTTNKLGMIRIESDHLGPQVISD